VEAAYFGFNHWRRHQVINATNELFTSYTDAAGNARFAGYGNLFTPFTNNQSTGTGTQLNPTLGFAGFDRANRHEVLYESDIHNVEVNLRVSGRPRPDRIVLHPNGRWRRECQPGIYGTSIFGIRYFSLDEHFNFTGTGATDIFDATGNMLYTVNSTGIYDITTSNDLLGLQFGMEILYQHCLWGWGAEAKVCPAINFARMKSAISSSTTDPGDPFSQSLNETRTGIRDQVALIGDVSVLGYYKVRPHITLRASWDMMWLVGVAMAPEQLYWVTNPPPLVNNHGTLFTQGVSLGIEWTH
jgi:hypothetical protein